MGYAKNMMEMKIRDITFIDPLDDGIFPDLADYIEDISDNKDYEDDDSNGSNDNNDDHGYPH